MQVYGEFLLENMLPHSTLSQEVFYISFEMILSTRRFLHGIYASLFSYDI